MSFAIRYIGHSCVLIESVQNLKILIDPYITGNENAKIRPEDLTDIDAIVVSHAAFDHFGDLIPIAKQTGATVYCGPEVCQYCLRKGIPAEQIRKVIWGTNWVHGDKIQIRSVEAKHISFAQFDDGSYMSGVPNSYIIRLEDGTGIYFGGDTAIFSDMKLFGELYPVQYGFIGVSGLVGYPYEMDGKEGALAASWLKLKVAMPIHYPKGSPEPAAFKEEFARLCPDCETLIMNPGERYVFENKIDPVDQQT